MGSQLALPLKGHCPSPQFSVHVCCGQTAGWMKTPLGTDVDLGPGHIVFDGDLAPPAKGAQQPPPLFSAHVCCDHGRSSQLLLSSCLFMAALCNRAGHIYFHPVVCSFFFFLSSPNLSRHRLYVYHTSTHGVALVRI